MQEQHAALAGGHVHSEGHVNQLDLAFQKPGGTMVQAASEAHSKKISESMTSKGPKNKPYQNANTESSKQTSDVRCALMLKCQSLGAPLPLYHSPYVQAVWTAADMNCFAATGSSGRS